jgi:indolepyruvate ferredoxin oxidoreductase beta subunit
VNTGIILCGVGGQGTVLASKLISASAMEKGIPVMSAETIGMAQRGGSVTSHIRIGEGVYSPMVPLGGADTIVGFEPGEAVRMLPYLKENGSAVVSSRVVIPVTEALVRSDYCSDRMIGFLREHVERLTVVDTDSAIREVGTAKVLNIILLGASIAAGALPVSAETLLDMIERRVPEKYIELNRRALEYGLSCVHD